MGELDFMVLNTIDFLVRMVEKQDPASLLSERDLQQFRRTWPEYVDRLVKIFRSTAAKNRSELLGLRSREPAIAAAVDDAVKRIDVLVAKYQLSGPGSEPEARESPQRRQDTGIPSCASQCVIAQLPCENRDLETRRCQECRYSRLSKAGSFR